MAEPARLPFKSATVAMLAALSTSSIPCAGAHARPSGAQPNHPLMPSAVLLTSSCQAGLQPHPHGSELRRTSRARKSGRQPMPEWTPRVQDGDREIAVGFLVFGAGSQK